MQLLFDIEAKVHGCQKNFEIATKNRTFLKEGTFTKISKGKAQTRHFFLFSDALLYCKIDQGNSNTPSLQTGGKKPSTLGTTRSNPKSQSSSSTDILMQGPMQIYHYAGHINLSKALIRDTADSKTAKNAIELVRIEKKKKPYIICFSSHQEKMEWLNQIVNLISEASTTSSQKTK